ncbi:AAA family ATPase [Jutongia huaianensis]|uniref:AAA family ATPase n=1 Tax=Jutongia huaianensis TaxID=2763668 RepID=A0ABR7MXR7_9FIRM|nr:AAA family ATPase [Jutongia huaianensis]MBC8561039.1 AAA family ATPase [Jutongia huaianensis]
MKKTISIGIQGFSDLRERNCYFVDKTHFIKEWWESQDMVTLITRPRRFGKTLNMSMLECFFSNKYANRADLFAGLSIWKEEKYRQLQGTYPVLFLSFASVKAGNLEEAKAQVKGEIARVYRENKYLIDTDIFDNRERERYDNVVVSMDDVTAQDSLRNLAEWMEKYYGKKVIIFLDEYDTPMQEAYIQGYWDEFTSFVRSLFNATFKTNPYLERAIMTGITRVSKESIFSDLNNLRVVTTTSDLYADCFGFTEEEVFAALDEYEMSDKKDEVKQWYDGFTFGEYRDIYNPWSITNYLKEKKLRAYWAATSSNGLVSRLIRTASVDVKEKMEDLLKGQEIVVNFDEQIVYNQLDQDENAIWSLLLASGYLKADQVEYRGMLNKPWYHLTITNLETESMFENMFAGWFKNQDANYNDFVKAMLKGSLKEMNIYMNDVALTTFSSFDTGRRPSRKTQPERFYHGFVLGLLADLRERYQIRSNRESGYGRYDVMLMPLNQQDKAIVIEFKVHEPDEESSLQDTVQSALDQIKEKNYDAELLAQGISADRICHYGFAFEGKKVLIGEVNNI